MRKNILITGLPGSGKSTLLKKVIEKYPLKTGFLTSELRTEGVRIGFEIETSNGIRSTLASVDFKSGPAVSKYRVNIKNLEAAISGITKFSENDLLYLDEIGQMELFSEKFKRLCRNYLDSDNICIVTISKVFDDEFTNAIKKRKDVIFVEINLSDRGEKFAFVEKLVGKIFKAKRYMVETQRFEYARDKIILHSEHGTREIEVNGDKLSCNCEFFNKNSVCSHIIAAEEVFKIV